MICKTSDSKNIYYEVKGNLQASESIIFLNGLSQTTDAWVFMIPFFEKEYKIVVLDFIFQGRSEKEGEYRNFDTHANDVVSVLDLLGLDQVSLIGLSYGSLVAQHFAVNHPNRLDKLVLLSTFAHKTPYYEAIELSWKNALDMGGYALMLDVMLPYVLSEAYFENPLIPIDFFKSVKKDAVDAKALSKLMRATAERKDFRKELHKIHNKTLVLQGRLDTLFPVYLGEEVAKNIKNSSFIIIENAGHTLNLECVDKVSTAILSFLKSE